jgi:hypothetical protein
MKNIHILQTDQPTSIFETNIGLQFSIINKVRHGEFKGFHLYITSDEEIKEGDWYLWEGYGGEYFKEKCEYLLYEGKKTKHLNCNKKTQFKVILTTDPALIADGVQAIDDEFLEWFCSKNGKVDFVEVMTIEDEKN